MRSAVHKKLHCYLNNLHFSNVLYYQAGCFGADFVGGVPRESWFKGQVAPACPVSDLGFLVLGSDFLLRSLTSHSRGTGSPSTFVPGSAARLGA